MDERQKADYSYFQNDRYALLWEVYMITFSQTFYHSKSTMMFIKMHDSTHTNKNQEYTLLTLK